MYRKYNCIRSKVTDKRKLLLSSTFLSLAILVFYKTAVVFLPDVYLKCLTKLRRIERIASERIQWIYRKVTAM